VIISPELIENAELAGKLFETAMVLQLDANFFWRDAYKNEVDIIKTTDKKTIPIEIKLSKIEEKSIIAFMKKFKIKKGIIITYDKKESIKRKDKIIKIMPFYEYLLEEN
jgi:hypothetical protein